MCDLKRLIMGAMLSGIAMSSAWADIPTGYYSKIDGQKKADLKSAVKACINSGKKTLSYSSLFNYYERTDVMPGTTNQVFDYYNTEVFYFTGTGSAPSNDSNTMNKEHACPQSWWGSGSLSNCYSDLFNVMPSESKANSAKSNYPVGIVASTKITYENPHMKVGTSATSDYTGMVFEPCDEFKGDFARIYLYVATCYDQAAWGSKSSVASTCAFTQETYPTVKSAFINLLLKWHREDPVSEWEIGRNERVYAEQNNRNPFIDYPQLAEYIWGDSTAFAFDLKNAKVNGYGAYTGGGTETPDPEEPDSTYVPSPYSSADSIFVETFADASEGANTSNNKCSTVWSGNDNFPSVTSAYQAGGAVKLGSSSKTGSITSRTIDYAGGQCVVLVKVKGWTTIEGSLKAAMTGASSQTLDYTAKLSDSFEELEFKFENVASNPKLTLSTTAGRCFIDNVLVLGVSSSAIEELDEEAVPDAPAYDLSGCALRSVQKGLNVYRGRLILVR